jgi:carbonic anhydrase
MNRLIEIHSKQDVFPEFQNTPIGDLLEYHNLERPLDPIDKAELLIGMCMDNRKSLRIPENFAYILRTGGGNLRHSEFKVSYAISIGGVKAIALLAHNHCGMVNLISKREDFVQGLIKAGWEKEFAEQHFMNFAPLFEIGNEIDFVMAEAQRLRQRYPNLLVAPLYYRIEDNAILQVRESQLCL